MRYTEHDFTIDHIFDFIRILFSSVFIAPWRLFHNITLKLIFIDKDKLTKFAQVAVALNILLIALECISLSKAVEFSFMYTRLPALIGCFILLAFVYYLIGIYDQPRINYGKKPQVFENKKPIIVPGAVGLALDDEDDDDNEIEQEVTKEKSNEDSMSYDAESEVDGMDFSSVLSGSVDIDKLRETSEEYSDLLDKAYSEDEFDMASFAELNKEENILFEQMAGDESAQVEDMLSIIDNIDFDELVG